MTEENTAVQDNNSVNMDNKTQNDAIQTVALVTENDTPQNTAQDGAPNQTEDQSIPTGVNQSSQVEATPSEASSNEESSNEDSPNANEVNSGAKVREYETPTLHEGVTRLGRLDQAYPDDEREREDIQGLPDEYINKPPYFLGDSSITPIFPSTGDWQAKEEGVKDGGNEEEFGNDTVMGKVTAIDPEGGPLQYFFKDSGAQTQELQLTHGSIKLDRATGEFTYTLDNEDVDTDSLAQKEDATDTAIVYVIDDKGLLGSNTLTLTIDIEGTNDEPVVTVEDASLTLKTTGLETVGVPTPDKATPNEPTAFTTKTPVAQEDKDTVGLLTEWTETLPPTNDKVFRISDGDSITASDVDNGAKLTYKFINVASTATFNENGNEQSITTDYGTITLNIIEGTYTYKLTDNAQAVRELQEEGWEKEIFTVQVTDEHGAIADKLHTISIHIEGTNDAPTLTITQDLGDETVENVDSLATKEKGVKDGGNVVEDGIPSVTGKLIPTDVDDDTFHYGIVTEFETDGTPKMHLLSPSGKECSYIIIQETIGEGANKITHAGQMTVKSDGTYIFTLGILDGEGNFTANAKAYDYLAAYDPANDDSIKDRESVDCTFVVYDNHGAWNTKTITIDIQGTNDAPTVSLMEATDGNAHKLKESGVVDILGDDDTTTGFENKDQGNTPVEVDQDNPDYRAVSTASGTIQGTDVDSDNLNGDGLVYTIKNGTTVGTTCTRITDYGVLTLDTVSGDYTYTLDDPNDSKNVINKLHQGQKVDQEFTFIIEDKHQATVEQKITFTIEGTNDQPVIAGAGAGAGVEGTTTFDLSVIDAYVDNVHKDYYKPEVSDPDTGDELANLTFKLGEVTYDDTNNPIDESNVANSSTSRLLTSYGWVTVNQTTGAYTYDLNRDPKTDAEKDAYEAVKNLDDGETLNDYFLYYVVDTKGATDYKLVKVTINGVDETPTFSTDLEIKTAIEKGWEQPGANVEGQLDAHDIDDTDDPLLTYVFKETSTDTNQSKATVITNGDAGVEYDIISEYDGDVLVAQTITTGYGTMRLDVSSGNYTYTLDQEYSEIQELLSTTKKPWVQFEILVKDPDSMVQSDGTITLSDTINLRVDIQGTNDAPDIGSVTSTVGGVESELTINSYPTTDSAGNPIDNKVKHYVEREIYVDPNNDDPFTGKIISSDVDHPDGPLTYSIVLDGKLVQTDSISHEIVTGEESLMCKYGHIILTQSTGDYKYVLDAETAQSLGVDSALETFTVRVTDPLGAYDNIDVVFKITDKDDLPELAGLEASVQEDNGDLVSSSDSKPFTEGQIIADDKDVKDVQSFHFATDKGYDIERDEDGKEIITTEGYGTITLDTKTGEYTYTLTSNDDDAIQKLNEATDPDNLVTLIDTFDVVVTSYDTGSQSAPFLDQTINETITITINGANDAPMFTATDEQTNLGSVTVNGVTTTLGTVPEVILDEASDDILDGILDGTSEVSLAFSDIDENHTLNLGFMHEFVDTNSAGVADEYTSIVKEGGIFKEGDMLKGINGQYGTLTIDDDGSYTYVLNSHFDWATSGLSASNPLQDKFLLTVRDEHGATDTQEVYVEIDWKQGGDGTTVTVVESANNTTVEEDVTKKVTGIIAMQDGSDVDLNKLYFLVDGKKVSSVTDEYGTVTISINSEGKVEYTYTLHNESSYVQALAENQTEDRDYTVHGDNGSDTFTVSIKGTNDAPVIEKVEPDAGQDNSVDEGSTTPISGTVVADDVDENDELAYSFQDYPSLMPDESGWISHETTYGIIKLNTTTGAYAYTLKGGLGDLPVGLGPETFAIKVSDERSPELYDTTELTIQIDTENTPPTIEGTLALSVTEDGADGGIVSATPDVKDLDVTDVNPDYINDIVSADADKLSYSIAYKDENDNVGESDSIIVKGKYGSLILDKDGKYTYFLDNGDETVQSLGDGQSAEDKFVYTVTDKSGTSVSKDVIVAITGTNDAPKVSVSKSSLFVHEPGDNVDTGDTKDSGTTTVTDIDANDIGDGKHTYLMTFVDGEGGTTTITGSDDEDDNFITTEYGKIILKADGSYSYEVDAEKTKSLNQGQIKEEQVTLSVVEVEDRGDAPVEQVITITIVGTNTPPVLDLSKSEAMPDAITPSSTLSDGKYVLEGDVSDFASDADETHTLSYSINSTNDPSKVPTALQMLQVYTKWNGYGTLTLDKETGEYSYTVDQAKVAALGVEGNTSVTENFTIVVSDDKKAIDQDQITMTITGVNDAPTWNVGERTLNVSADSPSRSFFTEFNDVDADDTCTFTIQHGEKTVIGETAIMDTTYGRLTINANNEKCIFALNDAGKAMVRGQTYTETFTISAKDSGNNEVDGTVTVNIKGVNHDPTIAGNLVPTYDADDNLATGTLTASDDDTGDNDALTFSLIDDDGDVDSDGVLILDYGTVTMTDGLYSYEVDKDKLVALLEDTPEEDWDTMLADLEDSFSVQVSDKYTGDAGTEGIDTAEVTLTLSLDITDAVVQQAIAEVTA